MVVVLESWSVRFKGYLLARRTASGYEFRNAVFPQFLNYVGQRRTLGTVVMSGHPSIVLLQLVLLALVFSIVSTAQSLQSNVFACKSVTVGLPPFTDLVTSTTHSSGTVPFRRESCTNNACIPACTLNCGWCKGVYVRPLSSDPPTSYSRDLLFTFVWNAVLGSTRDASNPCYPLKSL